MPARPKGVGEVDRVQTQTVPETAVATEGPAEAQPEQGPPIPEAPGAGDPEPEVTTTRRIIMYASKKLSDRVLIRGGKTGGPNPQDLDGPPLPSRPSIYAEWEEGIFVLDPDKEPWTEFYDETKYKIEHTRQFRAGSIWNKQDHDMTAQVNGLKALVAQAKDEQSKALLSEALAKMEQAMRGRSSEPEIVQGTRTTRSPGYGRPSMRPSGVVPLNAPWLATTR